MEPQKPVHTLVLDTGAIIKNEPPVSSMLKQSECLVTIPAIISEIKDAATRSRVETTLRPFLTLRSPNPASVKFVADFARRTGDLAVLSRPDLQIIALTYEIECERNGGDWRLRRVPGQKGLNGAPPSRVKNEESNADPAQSSVSTDAVVEEPSGLNDKTVSAEDLIPAESNNDADMTKESVVVEDDPLESDQDHAVEQDLSQEFAQSTLNDTQTQQDADSPKVDSTQNSEESHVDSDSDPGGWITPSNLKKKQAEDSSSSIVQTPEQKTMQVGVLTTDFAMQNVILQINLNLLSPSFTRVKHLKTFVLRCHACFQVTKDMSKQFCPRCGQPSLTRVSCSTDANGGFQLHLKKNMQWNHRGDRYSIPKPTHGSANGRVSGGGKGGWGNDLILSEDQKEYQRAVKGEKRQKAKDLMDEDYLPSILTGDRSRAGGKIKVGAGRNVNSRKR